MSRTIELPVTARVSTRADSDPLHAVSNHHVYTIRDLWKSGQAAAQWLFHVCLQWQGSINPDHWCILVPARER